MSNWVVWLTKRRCMFWMRWFIKNHWGERCPDKFLKGMDKECPECSCTICDARNYYDLLTEYVEDAK